MNLFKKRICYVLALVLVFALSACGGGTTSSAPASQAAPSETPSAADSQTPAPESSSDGIDPSALKVGVIMKSFDEFQQAVMDGAKDAAVELGIPEANITMVAPNNETELMAQVTMVEDLISKGVNILVIAVNQEDTVMNALNAAAAAGIQVVFADTQAPSFDRAVTYIGTDNEAAAYDGALAFGDVIGEGSKVVILRGKLGDVNHEARTKGLTQGLEEKGHTVLEVQDANCETDKAAAAMEAWITKYPDGIDAVMVTSDSMAVGAAQAIKGAGLTDKITVCGFDGFQSAISLVKTGEIKMIIGQKPYGMGYDAVKCGFGAMQGETYEPYMNPGIAIINADNVQDFAK